MVAWPVWVGGYPDPHEALHVLNELRESLRLELEERVISLLAVNAELGDFHYQTSDYTPIRGLLPRIYPPNSHELFISVEAPEAAFEQYADLNRTVAGVVEDLADLIKTFFQNQMPRATQGANLYEVGSYWEPGPRLQYTDTGDGGGMSIPNYYYGTKATLAWILGHYFFNAEHYTWLASEYFPYRLPNPKSSNPHLIYEDLYQPWKDRDDFDKYIDRVRLNMRNGVIAQEKAGTISQTDATRLKDICDDLDIVFFYPLVFRVDISAVDNPRHRTAGSGIW